MAHDNKRPRRSGKAGEASGEFAFGTEAPLSNIPEPVGAITCRLLKRIAESRAERVFASLEELALEPFYAVRIGVTAAFGQSRQIDLGIWHLQALRHALDEVHQEVRLLRMVA